MRETRPSFPEGFTQGGPEKIHGKRLQMQAGRIADTLETFVPLILTIRLLKKMNPYFDHFLGNPRLGEGNDRVPDTSQRGSLSPERDFLEFHNLSEHRAEETSLEKMSRTSLGQGCLAIYTPHCLLELQPHARTLKMDLVGNCTSSLLFPAWPHLIHLLFFLLFLTTCLIGL